MGISYLLKAPLFSFAIFLLLLICFHLLFPLLGYTFVPYSWLASNAFSGGMIVWLTIQEKRNRNEKTGAMTTVSGLLPLLAIAYILVKTADVFPPGSWTPVYATGDDAIIIIVQFCIVFACSFVLFFSSKLGKISKIVFGVLYCLAMGPVCLITAIAIDVGICSDVEWHKSEISPNGVYLVENGTQQSHGIEFVNVTKQNCDINMLVGKLKKKTYTITFSERSIEWYWESGDILVVNGNRYPIP